MSAKLITFIYTFRNRDTQRIEKSLRSLQKQQNQNFNVIFVDYGTSFPIEAESIKNTVSNFDFVDYYYSHSYYQPWNKARAINFALKKVTTPYIFIADVDVFYENKFTTVVEKIANPNKVIYFKAGYLSEEETQKEIIFSEYKSMFYSEEGATGWTLFPTESIKKYGGFDEFFHFWGSEDTDAHTRMKNVGLEIHFFTDEVLLLHQFHESFQRREKKELNKELIPDNIINLNYQNLAYHEKDKVTFVNYGIEKGKLLTKEEVDYLLNNIEITYEVSSLQPQVDYYINEVLKTQKNKIVQLVFEAKYESKAFKNKLKKLLKKNYKPHYNLQEINTLISKKIIFDFRHHHYAYFSNKELTKLHFIIQQ